MTIADRIRQVLEKFWPAGQRRAAEALGVPQATISRVVNGHRLPSSEMLAQLVKQTGVDANWLIGGTGNPFPVKPVRGVGLPVAACLLPGPPIDHPDLLTGEHESYWSATAFGEAAYVVAADFMLTGAINSRLVVSADPRPWKKNTYLLHGRLCAVKRLLGVELHTVSCRQRASHRNVDLYISELRLEEKDPDVGKFHAPIYVDPGPPPEPEMQEQAIKLSQIVGIVQLVYGRPELVSASNR